MQPSQQKYNSLVLFCNTNPLVLTGKLHREQNFVWVIKNVAKQIINLIAIHYSIFPFSKISNFLNSIPFSRPEFYSDTPAVNVNM